MKEELEEKILEVEELKQKIVELETELKETREESESYEAWADTYDSLRSVNAANFEHYKWLHDQIIQFAIKNIQFAIENQKSEPHSDQAFQPDKDQ